MGILFFLGISLAIAAPLVRRYRMGSPALVGGAFIVLTVVLVGLLDVNPRIGQEAINSNRRQYLLVLACELPVFILALISWRHSKWAFWLGWAINAVFGVYVLIIFVWLEYFWHW